jgi:uncharacterized protein (TIGR03435 family)
MRAVTFCGIMVVLSGLAMGESAPPAFEAVDLRPSPAGGSSTPAKASFSGGTFTMRSASVADMIGIAYGVHDYSLSGAPGWVERDRYDLTARTPATTPPETIKLMLRAMLTDRFRLASHAEEKSMSVFALTMGKGAPKLQPGDVSGGAGCQLHLPPRTPDLVTDNVYVCRNMTMEAFASTLHGLATSYLTSPVVDFTGLKGAWNFDVAWTSKGSLQITGAAGITVFEAVDKQMGLKLEEQRRPMPIFVIDHVEKFGGN